MTRLGPAAALLVLASTASADLGLQVARVASNEGAFFHRREVALVWQVVRVNGGPLPKKQAEFLQRHSPRVSLKKPCLRGNCTWSAHLSRDGKQPAALVLPADFWAIRLQPIWLDVLAYADWMVRGQRTSEDPCPIPPRTWGGPMDREEAIRERDLYPIGCAMFCGNRNACDDGFAFQADCWADGTWICDPLYMPVVETTDYTELRCYGE